MEKVVYALWAETADARDALNGRLLEKTGARLCDAARAVRINIQDNDVANAASPRSVATRPQMDAVVQLWLDSANDEARAPIDDIIHETAARAAAWLVCESTPIVNTAHPAAAGARTPGFSQIVFLGRPPRLTWDAWREAWQGQHTKPAIETQSNFEYQQNLVVRPLSYGAPAYAAMVEECFPIEALNDMRLYFDAAGDQEKFEKNMGVMMDSVARFIDQDRMDCFPTSQYDLKKLF